MCVCVCVCVCVVLCVCVLVRVQTWTPAEGSGDVTVRFTLFAPRMEYGHSVWVTGGARALGKWDSSARLRMAHVGRGIYIGQACHMSDRLFSSRACVSCVLDTDSSRACVRT